MTRSDANDANTIVDFQVLAVIGGALRLHLTGCAPRGRVWKLASYYAQRGCAVIVDA